jgi:hypothetical protein
LLGNTAAGKTTLLTQLHGRLQAGDGVLRARSAPESIAPIQAALQRLEQGLAVEHTPGTTDVEQVLHAVTSTGHSIDVVLPDYAGEALADIVVTRRISSTWQSRIRGAEHWILLLRLSQQPRLPNVLERPVANGRADTALAGLGPLPDRLPLDLWTVELLQILLHTRYTHDHVGPLPHLTVALSCWDELTYSAGIPSRILQEQLSPVAGFCAAHWPESRLTVVGLSAQGRSLHKDEETEDFVNFGPQQKGWLVTPEGERNGDLTRLLVYK